MDVVARHDWSSRGLCDESPKGDVLQVSSGVRVERSGKFFRLGSEHWYLKGVTYGPFVPNTAGLHLPESDQLQQDLAAIRRMGANALRVYHVPPVEFLDAAASQGLRVLVDVPWEKHRCFFEDWTARRAAQRRRRITAVPKRS